MSVHAGSQGQLGCIFLIPFPKQGSPPGNAAGSCAPSHRSCLQRAIVSHNRWGSVGSLRLECSGRKCQLWVLTRTGLNFLKITFELRDLGIFIMLGFYMGGLLLR